MSDEIGLDTLLKSTFTVDSVVHDELVISCRDLPQTTLLFILSSVVRAMKSELDADKDSLTASVSKFMATDSTEDGAAFVQLAVPIISRILIDSPELLNRFLLDVMVGAKAEHVQAIGVNDACVIIDTVIDRLDMQLIANTVKTVFSTAAATREKAKPPEIEQQNSEEEDI